MLSRSGVITLLTDFGTRDPYVGIMKGVILSRFPEATVIDLTHEVAPQDVVEGGFWLTESYRWFPPGTVHVAVVDPGVGTARAPLVIEADGHCFVGPDNGLFSAILERDFSARVFAIDPARIGATRVSATFHGRDVFAPTAALIAAERVVPSELGEPFTALRRQGIGVPEIGERSITGRVVAIDRFGNLISNIPGTLLPAGPGLVVECGGTEVPLLGTYGEARPGELLALIDSFGYLEVALRDGSAASGLSLGKGTPVKVVLPHPA